MKNEEKLFFVRANGEDLGIMTMRDAFRWSWDHGHCPIQTVRVSPKQTRKVKA